MRVGHEANVSTQQKQAKTDPWISHANEHPEWPECHQTKKGQGPKKARCLTSPPPGHYNSHTRSAKSARSSGAVGLGRPSRSGEAINTRYFTLYAGFASTKKRGLTLAFGVRAGPSTVRNRAKRQAREAVRLHRKKLPDGISIVITSRGNIGTLTRRGMRGQLSELLDRARALFPSQNPGGASQQ